MNLNTACLWANNRNNNTFEILEAEETVGLKQLLDDMEARDSQARDVGVKLVISLA